MTPEQEPLPEDALKTAAAAQEALDAMVQEFGAKVAKAKDDMLRDALIDLMSPYAFTVVLLDGMRIVGDRVELDGDGRPRWSADGVQVLGSQLVFVDAEQ